MNLINCSNKCIHQEDGFCMLETPQKAAISSKTDKHDCIYCDEIPGPVHGEKTPTAATPAPRAHF